MAWTTSARKGQGRRRTRSACTVSEVPSCSWCSWRGSRRVGDPAAQAVDADAQFPGNMAHGNIAGPGQQDRLMAELRGIRGNVRPMIGMGRSAKVAVAGPGWSVADVPGPRAGTGTGTMRRRAMMSPCQASMAGALATVHFLGASPPSSSATCQTVPTPRSNPRPLSPGKPATNVPSPQLGRFSRDTWSITCGRPSGRIGMSPGSSAPTTWPNVPQAGLPLA